MKYHSLQLKDKMFFDNFLKIRRRELSPCAFANIYIWKGLFDIFWTTIEDNLCIFFKDKIGTFLYLPPLGQRRSRNLVEMCFRAMDGFNTNKDISRIENVEEPDLGFFRALGYECIGKSSDYIYRSDKLSELKGNAYKSKRAAFNYFIKHYQFDYQPYSLKYKNACCNLYRDWMRNRKNKSRDSLYIKMLEDTFSSQKVALANYKKLDLIGRVVKINNQIKGYTFGFALGPQTFCILFEVTDLSIKGLSQFIFRKFVQEFADYPYINIMDDSGLDNLRRVKLSYRPVKQLPCYIIQRRRDV
jgi:hypothetical protein